MDITLYEIQPATFGRLLTSLSEHLPLIGYRQVDETVWQYGDHVVLRAVMASGETATVDHVRRTDAVLVSNDPNAITDWAMRPTFAREIGAKPWCFRMLSTMGCNVGGLMRSSRDIRDQWFELLYQQVDAAPKYRDLLLAKIEGDNSKWGYLLCDPVRWRDDTSSESAVLRAFQQYGYEMRMQWYCKDPIDFSDLTEQLFLTREERGEL